MAEEEWYKNDIKNLSSELKSQINLLGQIHSLDLEMDTKRFLTKRSHSLQIVLVLIALLIFE